MKGLHYVSLHDDSGYAEAGRRLLRALRSLGVPVTWTPMVHGMGWGLGYEPARPGTVEVPEDLAPLCHRPLRCDTVLVHTVPEYYPRWRREIARRGAPAPLVLAYTTWETTALPAHWPALLRGMDAVLVPSEWNRNLFAAALPGHAVMTLPHPCLESTCLESVRAAPERSDGPLRFYTINTWTARKALDLVVHAFLRTFDADDDVELVIKTSSEDRTRVRGRIARALLGPPRSAAALRRIVSQYARPPRVELVTRSLTRAELLEIHGRGDCFVTLSRGEGWGLGSFDAATLGRPVIAPAFGGPLDYLDDAASALVRWRPVAVADPHGGSSYTRDQRWAEPDLEHACSRLREIAENPEGARERSHDLASRLQDRFAGEAVARQLLADIESVRERARPSQGAA